MATTCHGDTVPVEASAAQAEASHQPGQSHRHILAAYVPSATSLPVRLS